MDWVSVSKWKCSIGVDVTNSVLPFQLIGALLLVTAVALKRNSITRPVNKTFVAIRRQEVERF